MCSDYLRGKSKSGPFHSQALGSDDGDDVGCADIAEATIGGRITDGGGGIEPLVAQVEEYVDVRLDWSGCGRLRTEVRDGLAADGILLIAEGHDNLGYLAEMLGESVPGKLI